MLVSHCPGHHPFHKFVHPHRLFLMTPCPSRVLLRTLISARLIPLLLFPLLSLPFRRRTLRNSIGSKELSFFPHLPRVPRLHFQPFHPMLPRERSHHLPLSNPLIIPRLREFIHHPRALFPGPCLRHSILSQAPLSPTINLSQPRPES